MDFLLPRDYHDFDKSVISTEVREEKRPQPPEMPERPSIWPRVIEVRPEPGGLVVGARDPVVVISRPESPERAVAEPADG